MAAVPIAIKGRYAFSSDGEVTIIGEAWNPNLSVGGGPIIPPDKPPNGGDGKPPDIWGGGNEPFPTPPINLPSIIIPPPDRPPPEIVPAPGEPPVSVPPPAGSGGWPVHPITIPPYIIVNYPGLGPIYVSPPVTGSSSK